jgi:hypothetical protein
MAQPFDSFCLNESHYILNLTISAPSINLSISMLFRILHILSILTGPNIFLSICLSNMRKLFSSFAVKVPVSDQYVTTGLIVVLYIFILVFLFSNFDFISFALAYYALLPFTVLSATSTFILLSAFKMVLSLHPFTLHGSFSIFHRHDMSRNCVSLNLLGVNTSIFVCRSLRWTELLLFRKMSCADHQ